MAQAGYVGRSYFRGKQSLAQEQWPKCVSFHQPPSFIRLFTVCRLWKAAWSLGSDKLPSTQSNKRHFNRTFFFLYTADTNPALFIYGSVSHQILQLRFCFGSDPAIYSVCISLHSFTLYPFYFYCDVLNTCFLSVVFPAAQSWVVCRNPCLNVFIYFILDPDCLQPEWFELWLNVSFITVNHSRRLFTETCSQKPTSVDCLIKRSTVWPQELSGVSLPKHRPLVASQNLN